MYIGQRQVENERSKAYYYAKNLTPAAYGGVSDEELRKTAAEIGVSYELMKEMYSKSQPKDYVSDKPAIEINGQLYMLGSPEAKKYLAEQAALKEGDLLVKSNTASQAGVYRNNKLIGFADSGTFASVQRSNAIQTPKAEKPDVRDVIFANSPVRANMLIGKYNQQVTEQQISNRLLFQKARDEGMMSLFQKPKTPIKNAQDKIDYFFERSLANVEEEGWKLPSDVRSEPLFSQTRAKSALTATSLFVIPATHSFVRTFSRPGETVLGIGKFLTLPLRPVEFMEEGLNLGMSFKRAPLQTAGSFGGQIFAFESAGRVARPLFKFSKDISNRAATRIKNPEVTLEYTTIDLGEGTKFYAEPSHLNRGIFGQYNRKTGQISYDPTQIALSRVRPSAYTKKDIILHEVGHKLVDTKDIGVIMERDFYLHKLPKSEQSFLVDAIKTKKKYYRIEEVSEEISADIYSFTLQGKKIGLPATQNYHLNQLKRNAIFPDDVIIKKEFFKFNKKYAGQIVTRQNLNLAQSQRGLSTVIRVRPLTKVVGASQEGSFFGIPKGKARLVFEKGKPEPASNVNIGNAVKVDLLKIQEIDMPGIKQKQLGTTALSKNPEKLYPEGKQIKPYTESFYLPKNKFLDILGKPGPYLKLEGGFRIGSIVNTRKSIILESYFIGNKARIGTRRQLIAGRLSEVNIKPSASSWRSKGKPMEVLDYQGGIGYAPKKSLMGKYKFEVDVPGGKLSNVYVYDSILPRGHRKPLVSVFKRDAVQMPLATTSILKAEKVNPFSPQERKKALRKQAEEEKSFDAVTSQSTRQTTVQILREQKQRPIFNQKGMLQQAQKSSSVQVQKQRPVTSGRQSALQKVFLFERLKAGSFQKLGTRLKSNARQRQSILLRSIQSGASLLDSRAASDVITIQKPVVVPITTPISIPKIKTATKTKQDLRYIQDFVWPFPKPGFPYEPRNIRPPKNPPKKMIVIPLDNAILPRKQKITDLSRRKYKPAYTADIYSQVFNIFKKKPKSKSFTGFEIRGIVRGG